MIRTRFIKLISCLIPSKEQRRKFRGKYIPKTPTSIIENNGTNNKAVIVHPNGSYEKIIYIEGLSIQFIGDNNVFKLYAPLPQFINCTIQMIDNAEFVLHESQYKLKDFIVWRMRKGTKLEIGKDFSCEGVEVALHGEENLQVHIGDDCMFSHDIFIQPTDNHSIINKESGLPINKGGNINIGNHVWLCPSVRIHKNVIIPDDCVVGTCSIVTKNIDEKGCVVVGMPAKAIKKNITWSRWSAQDYMEREFNENRN